MHEGFFCDEKYVPVCGNIYTAFKIYVSKMATLLIATAGYSKSTPPPTSFASGIEPLRKGQILISSRNRCQARVVRGVQASSPLTLVHFEAYTIFKLQVRSIFRSKRMVVLLNVCVRLEGGCTFTQRSGLILQ